MLHLEDEKTVTNKAPSHRRRSRAAASILAASAAGIPCVLACTEPLVHSPICSSTLNGCSTLLLPPHPQHAAATSAGGSGDAARCNNQIMPA
jgi:hypothetical protein